MSEVRNKKRNLITKWLTYKKAFDSVPHEWLIKSLDLAKLPEDLIRAIEHLISQQSKRGRRSNCVRYYIIHKRNISR